MANNRLIVQSGQTAGAILGSYDVFGSNSGAETVVVFDNTLAYFQADFARGGDTVKLADTATDFTIRIVGTNAELISTSDSIVTRIPIGVAGVTVQFETAPNVYGDSRSLIFSDGNVMLGGQIITSTATAVAPAAPPAGPAITGLESATGDSEPAAAKAVAVTLDAPAFAAFGGELHGAAADLQVAHVDAAFFARTSMESGMMNFVVNFA